MDTATSLAKLYQIINKHYGPVHAKKSINAAVSITISEIVEEGLEVTSELIDSRLSQYVDDFVEVDKTNDAA